MKNKLFYTLLVFLLNVPMLHAQDYRSSFLQRVETSQNLAGKKFRIEAKIHLEDKSTNAQILPALLTANEKAQLMNEYVDYYNKGNNDQAGSYWSTLTYTGKIKPQDKNAKYVAFGISFSGKAKIYLDDFKFFIDEKEIAIKNAGFETDSIAPWVFGNSKDKMTYQMVKNQEGTGQSLMIDNTQIQEEGPFGRNPKVGKYMNVNGVKLYYETYGKGEPLLLLHGNNVSMFSFYAQLNALSQHYQVIGLDSRGQGKSTCDSTRFTYELMAEDVNTFLDSLHLKKVNVLGWSDGGNIGVILAMRHPDKVHKMAITGTVLYNNSTSVAFWVNPLMNMEVKKMLINGVSKDDINYRLKMLLLTEPHINPDSLQKIQAPVLVMAGERDMVKEQHTKLIAEKIPHSTLKIFKKAGHEAPWQIPAEFNKTVLDFFDKKD